MLFNFYQKMNSTRLVAITKGPKAKLYFSFVIFHLCMSFSAFSKEVINIGYASAVPDFYQSSEMHAVRSKGWLELYLAQVPSKSWQFKFTHFTTPSKLQQALLNREIDVAFSDPIYFQNEGVLISDTVLSSSFSVVTKEPVANLNNAIMKNMSLSEYKGAVDFDFPFRVKSHINVKIEPSILLLQALKNITEKDIYIIPDLLMPYFPNAIKRQLHQLSVKKLAFSPSPKYAFIVLNNNLEELFKDINSTISGLSQSKQEQILQQAIDKIFFPALKQPNSEIKKLELTDEELTWVQSTPIVKVASGNSSASSPFDIIDINNSYTGISADYLALIGQLTGLKFVHTGSHSTLNILYGYQEKSWDIFTTLPHEVGNSLQVFRLSDKYNYFSWNVISRKEITINSVSDLNKLTFVPLPYSASEKLKQENPDMPVLATVNSAEAALHLVSSKEADFTILPSHSAPKLLSANNNDNLKLAYAFNSLKETIHFGIRKDLLVLEQIINKAIKNISAEQHASIRNKWFGSNYTVELDWNRALKQSSPLLIAITCLVLALIAWSRKLRQEVKNRIKVQNQLEVANTQAEQATKAKSLFLSTMSHEIRTPMNGIIGMLELLSESRLTTDQKRMLTTINSSSNSLMQIINDILDFSKMESDKLEIENIPYSLGHELESICDVMTKFALDKGVGFYLEIEPSLYGKIKGDPTRFRQIITNLISNAIKFTDHGQVSVIAKYNEHIDEKKEVIIFVKDTGIGMNKQQLAKLFQPFTQAESSTTRRFGGTGLGLAITQQLCKLMSFDLSVVSEVGHGTAFNISIPLSEIEDDIKIELWQTFCLIINQNTSLNILLESYLTHWNIPYRKVGIELPLSSLVEMANNADYVLLNIDDAYRLNFPIEQFGSQLNTTLINMTSQPVREHASLSFNPLLPSQLAFKLQPTPCTEATNANQQNKLMTLTRIEAEEQGLLVLVAEDHPTNRLVLQKQLDRLGIHADFAEDGVQAWANLQMKNYGMLLTDCHMPNMDGYSLAQKIRESKQFNDPPLPVVALTASVLESDKNKCLAVGMNDVVTKPTTIEMLHSTFIKWLKLEQNSIESKPNKTDIDNKLPTVNSIENEVFSNNESLYDHNFLTQMFGQDTNNLLLEFSACLTQDISDLRQANSNDLERIKNIAHRIKGAAESIMANSLVEQALVLETLPPKLVSSDVQLKVNELTLISDQLMREIEENVNHS